MLRKTDSQVTTMQELKKL